MKNLLVTGGAGFIGSNFVRYMLNKYPAYNIIVYDKLTYAGNLKNLREVQHKSRYKFVKGDIASKVIVEKTIRKYNIDTIINFAAETHVDRSIIEPDAFIQTDVMGVYVLLEAAKSHNIEKFLQVSTDEVYGSIPSGFSKENDPLLPNSPYAASKAGGELLVRAYNETYNLHTIVTRGSNTFGPYQYPEKFMPLFITNVIDDDPLPLYGDGHHVRDWLFVEDHCSGIDVALHHGESGSVFNIGGSNERTNLTLTRLILNHLGKPENLIRPVEDREGHDRRYALDSSKLESLGWKPSRAFEDDLVETIKWYKKNEGWWREIKESRKFQSYYKRQYGQRLHKSK